MHSTGSPELILIVYANGKKQYQAAYSRDDCEVRGCCLNEDIGKHSESAREHDASDCCLRTRNDGVATSFVDIVEDRFACEAEDNP